MDLVDFDYDELLAPLRSRIAALDDAIAEHEAEIKKLKQERAKPARILAAAERTPTKPGSSSKRNTHMVGVAPEKLDATADWLRANTNGEAFHASGLDARPDFDIIGHQSGISKALIELADRGVIRLDHRGTGGAKFYKLVEAN